MTADDDEKRMLDEVTRVLHEAADRQGVPRPKGPFLVIDGGKKLAEPPPRMRIAPPDDDPSAA